MGGKKSEGVGECGSEGGGRVERCVEVQIAPTGTTGILPVAKKGWPSQIPATTPPLLHQCSQTLWPLPHSLTHPLLHSPTPSLHAPFHLFTPSLPHSPTPSLHFSTSTATTHESTCGFCLQRPAFLWYNTRILRRDGRVVECTGLENRRAARSRGFESLSLRH